MGRPKNFSRQGVLAKALPVFWRHGYADTSLQALEHATGVNKSGLYAEFEGKEDLFLESLRYYLDEQAKKGLLTSAPLGWANIARFLRLAPCDIDGQKGCFSVSSMRELAILPPKAAALVTKSRTSLKHLLAKNVEAERTTMDPHAIADLVLTFFTGLSMEHNLKQSRSSVLRQIERFMKVLQSL
jgi:TetR/AcrR family transcriptional regulator, copper-responsive repressor